MQIEMEQGWSFPRNPATPMPKTSFCAEERLTFTSYGTLTAVKTYVHATFFQKVILCAFAGFLAAALIQWAKVFVEGADDALNKGYKHHSVMSTP